VDAVTGPRSPGCHTRSAAATGPESFQSTRRLSC
jgi:hypothetical protein